MNRYITITESERKAIWGLYGIEENNKLFKDIISYTYPINEQMATFQANKQTTPAKVDLLEIISKIRAWQRENPFTAITAELIITFIPFANVAPKVIYGLIIALDLYEIITGDYKDQDIKTPFFGVDGPTVNLIFDALSFFGAGLLRKELLLAKSSGSLKKSLVKYSNNIINFFGKIKPYIDNLINLVPDVFKNTLKTIIAKISASFNTINEKLKRFLNSLSGKILDSAEIAGKQTLKNYAWFNIFSTLVTESALMYEMYQLSKNNDKTDSVAKLFTSLSLIESTNEIIKKNNVNETQLNNILNLFKIDKLKEPNRYASIRFTLALNFSQILLIKNLSKLVEFLNYTYNNLKIPQTETKTNLSESAIINSLVNVIKNPIQTFSNVTKSIKSILNIDLMDPYMRDFLENHYNLTQTSVLEFEVFRVSGTNKVKSYKLKNINVDNFDNMTEAERQIIYTNYGLRSIFTGLNGQYGGIKKFNIGNLFYKYFKLKQKNLKMIPTDKRNEKFIKHLHEIQNESGGLREYPKRIITNKVKKILQEPKFKKIGELFNDFGLKYTKTIQERIDLSDKLDNLTKNVVKKIITVNQEKKVKQLTDDILNEKLPEIKILLRNFVEYDKIGKTQIKDFLLSLIDQLENLYKNNEGEKADEILKTFKTIFSYDKTDSLISTDNTSTKIIRMLYFEQELMEKLYKYNVPQSVAYERPLSAIFSETFMNAILLTSRRKNSINELKFEAKEVVTKIKKAKFMKTMGVIISSIATEMLTGIFANPFRIYENFKKFNLSQAALNSIRDYLITNLAIGTAASIYNLFIQWVNNFGESVEDDDTNDYVSFLKFSYNVIIKGFITSEITPLVNSIKYLYEDLVENPFHEIGKLVPESYLFIFSVKKFLEIVNLTFFERAYQYDNLTELLKNKKNEIYKHYYESYNKNLLTLMFKLKSVNTPKDNEKINSALDLAKKFGDDELLTLLRTDPIHLKSFFEKQKSKNNEFFKTSIKTINRVFGDNTTSDIGKSIDSTTSNIKSKFDSTKSRIGSKVDSLKSKIDSVSTKAGASVDSLRAKIEPKPEVLTDDVLIRELKINADSLEKIRQELYKIK